ncbi:MAG: hypothetical protein US86_C0005G0041 [Candidatus Daviesbacteria bacterium GW2011_GWA2_38_24]|uniref:RNA-binding protein KhpA n=1 Tax=Candidatus Daviesbacteria bacterium GW2011_GWA2_38_24 TaxID=1618422 RepID=A0A0G0JTR8_9BACT|nr:MAG: hypothetical protein US86_C0005G0041 [Candidatus Daviesbacteria bacterium GW2011_GWA2_38_24]KKQ79613.1 MAG: hypothetical protein UT01_C0033G0006 [Candidatus Daviesbacteria bacterium GW2011_GWA1_38_7]OGE22581.1 MAG: hypothetical protein A2688_03950 [Candidatus Daviesbacteria bacterium RIFCSPHIGHO2_01_FULL_38_8]
MKGIVEYIVKNLVSKPEVVEVEETREETTVNLGLKVDPTDVGMVIGKGGSIIKAIRKLLTVRAIVENVRVNLQVVEG